MNKIVYGRIVKSSVLKPEYNLRLNNKHINNKIKCSITLLPHENEIRCNNAFSAEPNIHITVRDLDVKFPIGCPKYDFKFHFRMKRRRNNFENIFR